MTPIIMIVILNAASTRAIPVAAFESMDACEKKRPAAQAIYLAEWPSAEVQCVELTFAPATSPRPKPRPRQVTEEDVLRALRQMMWEGEAI